MKTVGIVALVLTLVLIGALLLIAYWPQHWRSTSGDEVYLYRPPHGGYHDFRHAYTDSMQGSHQFATPEQVQEAARAGAYWLGVGYASDGALYALDGRGVARRYEQTDLIGRGGNRGSEQRRHRFGALLFGPKPAITERNTEHIAPWNEQGHGHLPVWSRHAQRYPNQYKNRNVRFGSDGSGGGGGGSGGETVLPSPPLLSPSPASPPAPLAPRLTSAASSMISMSNDYAS